jgi:hypothetical protein
MASRSVTSVSMCANDLSSSARSSARNREESLAAFLAKTAEFDVLLAELTQASEVHFGVDPETVHWGKAAWRSDATAKLQDIADPYFRRGEYEA